MSHRVVLPQQAAKAAERALKIRKTLPASRQYGTPAGLSQARKIAASREVDAARTWSFLSRAQPASVAARIAGKTARESKAIGAYDLWGGAAAYRYLRRLRDRNIRSRGVPWP